MKKLLAILSTVLGILSYGYLILQTVVGMGQGLSFTTFALWAMLAWIAVLSLIRHKANFSVPLIYAVGSSSISVILLLKGRFNWGIMDSVVVILVGFCVVLWLTRGARWALIASITASLIAGIPFIIMTWKFPEQSPILVNIFFTIVNFLSFLSVKGWRLEDRLYCGVNTIFCASFVLPWILSLF